MSLLFTTKDLVFHFNLMFKGFSSPTNLHNHGCVTNLIKLQNLLQFSFEVQY